MPQAPQLFGLFMVFVSQPLVVFASQLPKPELHEAMPHVPLEQLAVPFAGVEQTVPHAPQLLTLVFMFVSQPLAAFASQLPYPELQEPNPHVPLEQTAEPLLGVEQVVPHAPQCVVLVFKLTSHPLEGSPSQSAQPELQVPMPQTPPEHPAVALGGAEQVIPQAPQWATVVLRFVSQPLAVLASQFP